MMVGTAANIPNGWIRVRLGDLIKAPRPKIPPDPNSHLPFIGMDHIEARSFRLVGQDEFAKMRSAGSYFQPGDVLYGRLRPYLNKVHRAGFEGVASAEFIVFPDSPFLDGDFLKFLLHQQAFVDFAVSRSSGDRPRVKFDALAAFEFLLPPLNEQRRIAEKLESIFADLDKGEESLRHVQTLLDRYRQSVLKAAVTGELTAEWRAQRVGQLEHGRDLLARILKARRENWQGRGNYSEPLAPDTSGLPKLPEGWVWASVGQIAHVIGGLTKNGKRPSMPLRRPMLRVANVYQNRLDLSEIHETGVTESELERVLLNPLDLLVVEGNGSKDQIGRMALWRGEIPNAVHQNHLIKVRLVEKRLVEFLLWWFQSPNGRQMIENVASSTSGLYTLSISKIESLIAPVPSVEEAQEIACQVREAFARIDQLHAYTETELRRSAALRQSILKDAFAGKLVPQDSNDEPASELLARIRAQRETESRKTTRRMATA